MNAISQPPETTDVSGETMRQFFKQLNRFMLLMWRLGLSGYVGGNRWSGYIMVITHTGRKSGRRRRTPVNYALVDGDLYCLAASGRRADWYRNLLTQPAVEVWLPTGRWAGLAQDANRHPRRTDLVRQVLIQSGFAAYAAGLNPRRMSNRELEAATAPYRLVRIQPEEALTGPGGPGDLTWVWPLSTFLLLAFSLRRRSRHD
jgi:deazaflavin-dependent oxidoreductase (nitroreductase family)